MNVRTRQAAALFAALLALAVVSWLLFLGYLTPEMLVYFISFRWCF